MRTTPISELEGLILVELDVYGDARGFFVERFNEEKYRRQGLKTRFVQDNHSRSAPGVVRGLHYQYEPAQGKLVSVTRGRILDVVVDIRADSPTFGKHFSLELNDLEGRMLWIPGGFAHGFSVLGDEPADVFYKVDQFYNPAKEGGISWNDPELGIDWKVASPTISARDQKQPSFSEYRVHPIRDWS